MVALDSLRHSKDEKLKWVVPSHVSKQSVVICKPGPEGDYQSQNEARKVPALAGVKSEYLVVDCDIPSCGGAHG